MRQTKLLETLGSLTVRERNRWRQYVWSDYGNRHKVLRSLCDLMLEGVAEATSLLPKKQMYEQLFGTQKPYNELIFNNLVSDLYELLLDWLALEKHWADPLEQQRRRLELLVERRLDKQATAALKRFEVMLAQSPLRNADWYRHALALEEAAEALHSRLPRRTESPHVWRQAQYTRYIHALESLAMALALRSRTQLAVMQAETAPFGPEELQWIRRDEPMLEALPVARAYLAAYDLLENRSQESFEALTGMLQDIHTTMSADELQSLYQCALNHCIRRINQGQGEAYTDVLTLYKRLLERGLLLQQGGMLSQWTYKNIATAGLRTGAYAWTEEFLQTYRDRLPPVERDNAYAFNAASLYFEKQDYAAMLQTLQNVEFKDITYHIGAKALQLKAYYLLEEEEAFGSLLASTEQLLRRDKTLSTFGKAINLNFLRMLRLLSKFRRNSRHYTQQKAAKERAALLDKIRQTQPLANKDWLERVV